MKNKSSLFHPFFRPILFFGLILNLSFAGAGEDDWSVEKLMQLLSEVKYAELGFVETKQSIFLVTNVTLEGDMVYRAPDYMEKNTVSPFFEKVTIDGDSMVIEKIVKVGKDDDIQQTQEFSVQSHPLLKTAVESIRAMLAGNYELLNENYTIRLEGDREVWRLNLAPKSSEILDYIEQINLTGSDSKIMEVITIQADGDESRMDLIYKIMK